MRYTVYRLAAREARPVSLNKREERMILRWTVTRLIFVIWLPKEINKARNYALNKRMIALSKLGGEAVLFLLR